MRILNKTSYLFIVLAYFMPSIASADVCTKYKTCKEKLACTIAVNLFSNNKPTEWETLIAKTLVDNTECDNYRYPNNNTDLTFNEFKPAASLKIDWTLVGQYRASYLNDPQYGRYGIAFIESDGALGVGVVTGAAVAAAVGIYFAAPAALGAMGVGTATAPATGLGATAVGGHLAGVVGGTGTVATIGGGATLVTAGIGGGAAAAGMANGLMRYNQMDEVIKNSRTWSDYAGCFNECDNNDVTLEKTDLLTRYVLQPLFNNNNSYCVNNNDGKLNLLYTNGKPMIMTQARGKEILLSIASKIADKGMCDGHVFDMDAYIIQFLYDTNGNLMQKYIVASEPEHIDD